MAKNSLALPDHLIGLLAAADKSRGFPLGTMASIMSQEIGGRPDILANPETYHYAAGPDGRRVAGHTGKVSTAFGPFGILESTGRDPGYGVKPLQNKTLEEQIRFAADYLDARSKSAGSLQAGLAGYGEGARYSQQVARRRDGDDSAANVAAAQALQARAAAGPMGPVQDPPPLQIADARMGVQAPVLQTIPEAVAPRMGDPSQDAWAKYLRENPIGGERPVEQAAAQAPAAPAAATGFRLGAEEVAALYDIPLSNRPNFGLFQGLARLGRKS